MAALGQQVLLTSTLDLRTCTDMYACVLGAAAKRSYNLWVSSQQSSYTVFIYHTSDIKSDMIGYMNVSYYSYTPHQYWSADFELMNEGIHLDLDTWICCLSFFIRDLKNHGR